MKSERLPVFMFDFPADDLVDGVHQICTGREAMLSVLKGDEVWIQWGLIRVQGTVEDIIPVSLGFSAFHVRPHGRTIAVDCERH